MTTPLLLLRAVQLGVQIGEMDLLTIGTINDMYTETRDHTALWHLRMIWIDSRRDNRTLL